jgi:hypothetical protein
MVLLCATIQRIEGEVSQGRSERDAAIAESSAWQKRYYDEREQKSVISERLKNATSMNRVQNVLLGLGGVVLGLAVPHLGESNNPWPISATALGALLMICGWWLPREKR